MPTLTELLNPAETAVITVEMQRGVIGDQVGANGAALTEAVEKAGSIALTTKLLRAARAAGVRVVHATITLRADRAGLSVNNRMMASIVRNPDQMLEGTPAVELIPELELDRTNDLVMNRVHGLTPFGGTELDPVLRNLGVRTLIPVGVSLNVAILGTCLAASDLGYQIVLPRDAIIALPESYAEQVFTNTLSHLATVTTVDDVIAAWG